MLDQIRQHRLPRGGGDRRCRVIVEVNCAHLASEDLGDGDGALDRFTGDISAFANAFTLKVALSEITVNPRVVRPETPIYAAPATWIG